MPTNDDYLSAAGRPNIGSKPSASLMKKTRDVAIGKPSTRSAGSIMVSGSLARSSDNKPKGSWEGYMHAPSAHLHANGTGYERVPKARGFNRATNLPKFANTNNIASTRFNMGMANLSHMNMSKSSSMSRLASLMRLNKLF